MSETGGNAVTSAVKDASLRKFIFTRVTLPLLAVAASIFQFAWLYETEAEQDRLQRQCQTFIHALANQQSGYELAYGWLKGNERAADVAGYLALALKLTPANGKYCAVPK